MTKVLMATAAVIIILGGLMVAKVIVAPLILSIFFAVILIPPLRWLKKKGIPDLVALILLSTLIFLCGIGMIALVGSSLNRFHDRLPDYQVKFKTNISMLEERIQSFLDSLEEETIGRIVTTDTPAGSPSEILTVPDTPPATPPPVNEAVREVIAEDTKLLPPDGDQASGLPPPKDFSITDLIDAPTLYNIAISVTKEAISMSSVMFIVMVTVIFMLLEASRFSEKVEAAFGPEYNTNKQMEEIAASIWNYMVIKGWISLATGIATWLFLWLIGVEYALLWGVLAFFLNFIPNIGSIIASIPPILLAWLDLGVGSAVLATVGLIGINFAIGYGVEPKYLGDGLGISGLIVLLSLIFWGWLLGPVGMFLSAPLTMIVKIVLQTYDRTRWIAILLSSTVPPPEKRN